MTEDEVIEMYLEVSNKLCNGTEWCWAGVGEPLQLFAKLVAEREREWLLGYIQEHQPSCEQMSNAIRARGQA